MKARVLTTAAGTALQKDYVVVPADGPYPEARLSLQQAAAVAEMVEGLSAFQAMKKPTQGTK